MECVTICVDIRGGGISVIWDENIQFGLRSHSTPRYLLNMMTVVGFNHAVSVSSVHGGDRDGGRRGFTLHRQPHTIRMDSRYGKRLCKRLKFNKFPTACSSLHCPNSTSSSTKKDESILILIRHGESMWNEKNLFTGCVDVPLTEKGVEEAIEAGKRIKNMPLDIVYTSALVRSQMTAMLALTEHHCMKVPIFLHNENEESRIWNQIYSECTKKQTIPVVKAWQLNERMYGELQGFNKKATAELYGKDQVQKWRRSYDVRPPNGESLEMCLERAVTFFKQQIEPQLMIGKHVMVVAHANSLRSIIMYLDKLTSQEVIDLELSTGVPMLYIYNQGKFIRRGSPIGSTEAGAYAYTESLAFYRQQLDEITK